MLEEYLDLFEHDQFSEALDNMMASLKTAADGMKKSPRGIQTKVEKITQPWSDEECACFRGKALKALRFFCEMRALESLEIYPNSKETYRNIINIINKKKDAYNREQTFKLEKACENKNPKEFWQFLKSDKCSTSVKISANEWFYYFSNLLNSKLKRIMILKRKRQL